MKKTWIALTVVASLALGGATAMAAGASTPQNKTTAVEKQQTKAAKQQVKAEKKQAREAKKADKAAKQAAHHEKLLKAAAKHNIATDGRSDEAIKADLKNLVQEKRAARQK